MIMMMTSPPDDATPPATEAALPTPPKKKTGRNPPDRWPDPWQDWRPVWTVKKTGTTTHDMQEKHSPTEEVSIRITSDRSYVGGRQRIVDARLWSAMTPAQQKAAICVARAFETMGRGLGYAASDWERIPGESYSGETASERHARLIREYIEWTTACAREKISHAMIIDILSFGKPCSAVDRERRVRTGTARSNLLQGLALYCRLLGWR